MSVAASNLQDAPTALRRASRIALSFTLPIPTRLSLAAAQSPED
jgi:hypothetical protein